MDIQFVIQSMEECAVTIQPENMTQPENMIQPENTIPPEDYPDWNMDEHYDVGVVFHKSDEIAAHAYCNMLQRLIDDVKILRFDSTRKLIELEPAFDKCTFIFIFVTDSFLSSSFCEHQKDEMIMKATEQFEKRWKIVPVVPVWPQKGLPMGLKSIKAQTLTRICRGKTWADDSQSIGDTLDKINPTNIKDIDRFFVPQLKSLLESKAYMRKERELNNKKDLESTNVSRLVCR